MVSRMFHKVTRTWNPITGCLHLCRYCWARRLAEGRLKNTKKYSEGFKPRFHPEELSKKFRPGEFVFVSDMGDMWGSWVFERWIWEVLNHIAKFPKTTFLFLTKNPARYFEFLDELSHMDNVILGATIETDFDKVYWAYGISNAPSPSRRLKAMKWIRMVNGNVRLMVSVEPIIQVKDVYEFSKEIAEINPEFVYVGYDNYNNKLPEPSLEQTLKLIELLEAYGVTVYRKTLRKAWWEK